MTTEKKYCAARTILSESGGEPADGSSVLKTDTKGLTAAVVDSWLKTCSHLRDLEQACVDYGTTNSVTNIN